VEEMKDIIVLLDHPIQKETETVTVTGIETETTEITIHVLRDNALVHLDTTTAIARIIILLLLLLRGGTGIVSMKGGGIQNAITMVVRVGEGTLTKGEGTITEEEEETTTIEVLPLLVDTEEEEEDTEMIGEVVDPLVEEEEEEEGKEEDLRSKDSPIKETVITGLLLQKIRSPFRNARDLLRRGT
jgi:hypothetical protein